MSGRYGGMQPNVLIDLAGSYGAGMQIGQQEQRNRLFMEQTQRDRADDDAFRSIAPRVAQRDPAAMLEAVALNPQRAGQMQTVLNGMDDQQWQRGQRILEATARAGQGLLDLPDAQWGGVWPGLRQQFGALGVQLPDAPPSRAQIESIVRASIPAATMWATRQQQERDRIAPVAGYGAPAGAGAMPPAVPASTGGAAPPPIAAGTPQTQAQRSAVDWLKTAREEALATLTGPALDARLTEINEQAGVQMGRRAGGSTTAFAGAGGGQAPAQPAAAPAGQAPAQPAAATAASPAAGQWPPPGYTPLGRNGVPIVQGTLHLMQGPNGREWIERPARQSATPPSYDTVQTAEGVFRVNSRDPNDRVRIGDRPRTGPADGRLPAALVKMDEEDVGVIQSAGGMSADLARFRDMVGTPQLPLSGFGNLARGGMNSLGLSNEASRNLASFQATLERLRNESLRLNKGVQTDQDATRAWNELLTNINDEGVVKQRLAEIAKLNQRAIQLRLAAMNRRRQENGAQPIRIEDIGGVPQSTVGLGNQGQPPPTPQQGGAGQPPPTGQQPAQGSYMPPIPGQIEDGHEFLGGDPKEASSWRRI